MQRERISENVYWFQSEIYAQVTAGVIVGPQWAIVVDTLPVPEETIAMRDFVTQDLKLPVRYLINTHSHSDHAWGNCFFPGATIISHRRCAELLATEGVKALAETREVNPAYRNTHIVLPHITIDSGELILKAGKKKLILMLTPGHTEDGISVYVEDDHVLFAGDSFMPVPSLSEGNFRDTLLNYEKFGKMGLENIIQGHGDIILRGEIDDAIRQNVKYMRKIYEAGLAARLKRNPGSYLSEIDIESCGKSRAFLSGMAEELHKRNLIWIYRQLIAEMGKPSEDEYDPEPDEDDFESMLPDVDFSSSASQDEDMPEDFNEDWDDDRLNADSADMDDDDF